MTTMITAVSMTYPPLLPSEMGYGGGSKVWLGPGVALALALLLDIP